MFFPRHFYELSSKRIGRHLKATCLRGLILNPLSNLKIDSYTDAEFSGMYGLKKTNDLASRTGCVITVVDCLVLWQSKLQRETALSTMGAEAIVLAHSCRE